MMHRTAWPVAACTAAILAGVGIDVSRADVVAVVERPDTVTTNTHYVGNHAPLLSAFPVLGINATAHRWIKPEQTSTG